MKRRMFSIYDEKAEAYIQPFFMETAGQAIRAITDCVNDPQHQFNRHSSDYTLFSLGTFDDSDGTIEWNKVPMGNLVEFKKKEKPLPGQLSLVEDK